MRLWPEWKDTLVILLIWYFFIFLFFLQEPVCTLYIFLSNHNSCLFTPTLTPLKETFPIRRWHLRLHQLELQLRSERHLLLQGDHLQRQEGSHKQPGLNYLLLMTSIVTKQNIFSKISGQIQFPRFANIDIFNFRFLTMITRMTNW